MVDVDRPNTDLTQVTYVSKNKDNDNNMLKSLNEFDLVLYATDSSRFDDRWDSSYSVRIYSTVRGKKKYRYDGVPLAKFYSVCRGYVLNDKQISVTCQHIILKASAIVESGETTLDQREYGNKNSYWVYYASTN